ncbi:3-hydroxyacyl-CoA dehydrogenase family protein [Rhizorhabdus histidinilytica]
MAEEGVASPEDIDTAIRVGFGLRFAVLGLLDSSTGAGAISSTTPAPSCRRQSTLGASLLPRSSARTWRRRGGACATGRVSTTMMASTSAPIAAGGSPISSRCCASAT